MKTQELNNTKISGSSWSWPNSLHFSLSKPIQTARTSERYSQTKRATWKRERQAELPKRDTLHPSDLSSSHAVNFWFSTFINHHYPGVGYWWYSWVITEPVVVGSPKVKINKKQPHNAGQYPWVWVHLHHTSSSISRLPAYSKGFPWSLGSNILSLVVTIIQRSKGKN